MLKLLHKSRTRTVEYIFEQPPIPDRNFDWAATFTDHDYGDPIGFGRTREAALKDLLLQLEE